MSSNATMNGREVDVVSREKSRFAGGDEYSMESLILAGVHDDLQVGMDVDILLLDERLIGRVTFVATDPVTNITHLRVYRG